MSGLSTSRISIQADPVNGQDITVIAVEMHDPTPAKPPPPKPPPRRHRKPKPPPKPAIAALMISNDDNQASKAIPQDSTTMAKEDMNAHENSVKHSADIRNTTSLDGATDSPTTHAISDEDYSRRIASNITDSTTQPQPNTEYLPSTQLPKDLSPISSRSRQEWKSKMVEEKLPPGFIDELQGNTVFISKQDIQTDDNLKAGKSSEIISEARLDSPHKTALPKHKEHKIDYNESYREALENPGKLYNIQRPKQRGVSEALPIDRVNSVSTVSSESTSAAPYEEQDIDNILDQVSVTSNNTFSDVEENNNNQNVIMTDQFREESPGIYATYVDHLDRVGLDENSNANTQRKRFKMRNRQKLDKAATAHSRYLPADSRSPNNNALRRGLNANSLDRDALETGEYFSAGDVCDYSFSSQSFDSKQGSQENILKSRRSGKEYIEIMDGILIPVGPESGHVTSTANRMSQSGDSLFNENDSSDVSPVKEISPLNAPPDLLNTTFKAMSDSGVSLGDTSHNKEGRLKSGLPRQDAVEMSACRTSGDGEENPRSSPVIAFNEHTHMSPWVRRNQELEEQLGTYWRRTQSEDVRLGTPREKYAQVRIYHSHESEIL